MQLELIAFFVLGLVGIGYVVSTIAKTVSKETAKGVVVWGCIAISLWILYVGGSTLIWLFEKNAAG